MRQAATLTTLLAVMLVAADLASAEVITLRRGLDGYDGVIDARLRIDEDNGGYGDYNMGTHAIIGVGHGSDNVLDRGIIRFDLSDYSGTYATEDATLTFTVSHNLGFDGRTIQLYRIKSADTGWIEGAHEFEHATTGEPCWNFQAYDTVAWAGGAGLGAAGGDSYYTNYIDTFTAPAGMSVGTEVEFTISKDIINAWISDPSDNAGMLLRDSSETYTSGSECRMFFCASDEMTNTNRPTLTMTLAVLAIPEPSAIVLLGAGALGLGLLRVLLRKRNL